MRRWIFFIFACLALALLLFLEPQEMLAPRSFLLGGFGNDGSRERELIAENQALRARAALFEEAARRLSPQQPASIDAFAYSGYAFNLKGAIIVNKGKEDGVRAGYPVVVAVPSQNSSTVSDGILVGAIERVFDHYAVVRTVFDPAWQSAVRVGAEGIDALLLGGNEPKITLLPKETLVQSGDIVYSASRDFPYGLAIGDAGSTFPSADGLFKEAHVRTGYDVNRLHLVTILAYDPPQSP